jgi:hypothetical protein
VDGRSCRGEPRREVRTAPPCGEAVVKPSQPMMSAAQATRALGERIYRALVKAGELHPLADEHGIVRVPISDIERYLSPMERGVAIDVMRPSITIIAREDFARIKDWFSMPDADWTILQQRSADPRAEFRVEFLVLLYTPRGFRAFDASRTDLHRAVKEALRVVRREGLEPMLILDTDSEAFKILAPALALEPDGAPLAALLVPPPDAFTKQIDETRKAMRRPKEPGNE